MSEPSDPSRPDLQTSDPHGPVSDDATASAAPDGPTAPAPAPGAANTPGGHDAPAQDASGAPGTYPPYGAGGQTAPPGQYGAPQYGSEQPGGPQYGGPQYAAPQYGGPQYGGSQYGAPQYGSPQYVSPQYGAPQYGGSQYAAPQYGGSQYGAPQYESPQYGAPQAGTVQPGGHAGYPTTAEQPTQAGGQFGGDQFSAMATPRATHGRRTVLLIGVGAVVLIAAILLFTAFVIPGWAPKTISQDAVQDGVRQVLTEDYQASDVSAVSCPSGQRVEEGSSFDCTATVGGQEQTVTVTFLDDDGTYEVSRPTN